jgi:ketosteroid isomerase-like protein
MKISNFESIIQAEKMLAHAHVTMDIETIDALLHEDYVIVQPGGKIETKSEVLASYKTGNRHWDRAEVDQLEVKIYGNMARVIGIWRAAGTNNGQAFDYQACFISIWVKEDESWKNISYSSAEMSSLPHPSE